MFLFGQIGDARQGVGNEDDDEDHAFGDDKDYGAGALDKPDRGNQGGTDVLIAYFASSRYKI